MVGDPGKPCCLLDLIGLAKYSAAALFKPGRVKQAASPDLRRLRPFGTADCQTLRVELLSQEPPQQR